MMADSREKHGKKGEEGAMANKAATRDAAC